MSISFSQMPSFEDVQMCDGRKEKMADLQPVVKERKPTKEETEEGKPTMDEIWKNTFSNSKLAESSSLSSSDEDDDDQSSSSESSSSSEDEMSPQKGNWRDDETKRGSLHTSPTLYSSEEESRSKKEMREYNLLDEGVVAVEEIEDVMAEVEVREMEGNLEEEKDLQEEEEEEEEEKGIPS